MLGFKEYLTTSFDILLSSRIRNFFFLYYGRLLPLLVEDKQFFFDGEEEISIKEGTLKTIKLYAGTSFVAPAGTSFIASIPPGVRKYYEVAAEYLLDNNLLSVTPDDSSVTNILAIKFFEELYKFKKEISLKIFNEGLSDVDTQKLEEYFEYLKTEETVDFETLTVYENQLNLAIGGDSSVINASTKYNSDSEIGIAVCCKFDNKEPAAIGNAENFPEGASQDVINLHNKIVKIISLAKEGGQSRKIQIQEIFDDLTKEERCYLCKRKEDADGNSALYFVEDQYGKLNSGQENLGIAKALGCKDLGFSSFRGAVKGGTVKGLAATKCTSTIPPAGGGANLNYGKTELQQSLVAVDYDSGYFTDLDKAVEEVNDKIDQNLITLIDGE